MVPLVWRVKVFPSFLLFTLLQELCFLVKQKEHGAVEGATEVILNTTLLPPPRHNYLIQTTAQKSSNGHYLCGTALQYIIPLETYPFPHTDLQYSEHAAIFSPLHGLWPSATAWLHSLCSNWDLKLNPRTANLRFLGTLPASNRWPLSAANGSQRTHIRRPWH